MKYKYLIIAEKEIKGNDSYNNGDIKQVIDISSYSKEKVKELIKQNKYTYFTNDYRYTDNTTFGKKAKELIDLWKE